MTDIRPEDTGDLDPPDVSLTSEEEVRRREIMAPFTVRRTATLQHFGEKIAIRLEELPACRASQAPDEEVRVQMVQDVMTSLQEAMKEKGWTLMFHPGIPLHLPEAEPDAESAEAYHARTRSLRENLEAAGVSGADEVENLPAGWTRVLERAGAGIVARLSLPDAGYVRIIQAKEKFGTLRFYVSAEGSDAFTADIFEIAQWAENATEERCCVTGKPGSLDGSGWVLTLCPEMKALRMQDRAAFSDRIYPPPPRVAELAGPEA